MSDYLFAYGTLQPGFAPARIAALAAQMRPVGRGFVRGALYDLGRYAGAVSDPNSEGRISGTVMQLPDDQIFLRRLDAYEGFDPRAPEDSEYIRERHIVELAEGGIRECWFYRYNRETDKTRAIANGVWTRRPGRTD